LICFRPILEGKKVGEDLRFPKPVSGSSNGSDETTVNKSSSGNEDTKVSSSNGIESISVETQLQSSEAKSDSRPPKKRSFEQVDEGKNIEELPSSKRCADKSKEQDRSN
jgi:hypothetical protein